MNEPGRHVVVITPVLDDWVCLTMLVDRLRDILGQSAWTVSIVAVDDGSLAAAPPSLDADDITILRLSRNVGHQRAIAVGLDYVVRETDADVFAIMDADGEDRPEDLPLLLDALGDARNRVVVASRRHRSEGLAFLAFYRAFKAVFRVLTGERLDFGNFSVFRRGPASRLTAMHELWLNLPATIMRARVELVRVPLDRDRRYAGRSRMRLVGLVTHGLSAVGVFVERVFTRMLLGIGGVAALLFSSLLLGLVLKAAGLATPGWVTTIAASLVIVLVQTATVALCGLFVVFGNASNVGLAPAATGRTLIASVHGRASSRRRPATPVIAAR